MDFNIYDILKKGFYIYDEKNKCYSFIANNHNLITLNYDSINKFYIKYKSLKTNKYNKVLLEDYGKTWWVDLDRSNCNE